MTRRFPEPAWPFAPPPDVEDLVADVTTVDTLQDQRCPRCGDLVHEDRVYCEICRPFAHEPKYWEAP